MHARAQLVTAQTVRAVMLPCLVDRIVQWQKFQRFFSFFFDTNYGWQQVLGFHPPLGLHILGPLFFCFGEQSSSVFLFSKPQ
jgi:hypothetical protein